MSIHLIENFSHEFVVHGDLFLKLWPWTRQNLFVHDQVSLIPVTFDSSNVYEEVKKSKG